MTRLEQARAFRDRMLAQLNDFRENHAAKSLAYDTARTAVINHRDQAASTQTQLESVSAQLASVVGSGASESIRAPLRNQVSDLRSTIEHHKTEAARIEPTLPDLERNFNSTKAGLAGPLEQYHVAHFEALACEWVEALAQIAPLWAQVKSAARDAGKTLDSEHRKWQGLVIDAENPKIAHLEFPEFPRG
jgi:hypothetical protein